MSFPSCASSTGDAGGTGAAKRVASCLGEAVMEGVAESATEGVVVGAVVAVVTQAQRNRGSHMEIN